MSLTFVRAPARDPKLSELGITSSSLGGLRYTLPAAGRVTRDVYSADAVLTAEIDGQPERVAGRCTITVHAGVATGLLPADGESTPVWFSLTLAELRASPQGSAGRLRKRPAAVRLEAAGLDLVLSDVDKLLLSLEQYQSGQESGLLHALQRSRA